ncbi:MAG: hypothetical protein ACNA7J_12375 [Wenzhouxiangella sp.]
MIRSVGIAVFLPLALFASSISSYAIASEPSDIGFVLYTRSDSPGTLNARWMYGEQYRGPGIATGGPRDGFAGEYHVRYFFENGDFSDEYDLVIARTGDIYKATWLIEGKTAAVGVGMEVENGLAIGWHRVKD